MICLQLYYIVWSFGQREKKKACKNRPFWVSPDFSGYILVELSGIEPLAS